MRYLVLAIVMMLGCGDDPMPFGVASDARRPPAGTGGMDGELGGAAGMPLDGTGGMVVAGTGGADAGTGGTTVAGTGGATAIPGTGGTIGGTGGTVAPVDPPTVEILLDRSISMFNCIDNDTGLACRDAVNSAWGRLKPLVLGVVEAYQDRVRFGLSAFVGADATCPTMDRVPAALNNLPAIRAFWNAVPVPEATSARMYTPLGAVLDAAGAALKTDPAPGRKTVLLVTDGETNYCGATGNTLCPPDSVVGRLQGLFSAGIRTLVFGLPYTGATDFPPGVLEAFATAGVGEPTKAALRPGSALVALYDQCASAVDWKRDFDAAGRTMRGQGVGVYASTAGATKPFVPGVETIESARIRFAQMVLP